MGLSRHVFLVGFMGSGKSTVGRMVAGSLGVRFVDLDAVIESAAGEPIPQIFSNQGEEAFRDLESEALESLEGEEPSVVACGGGVVLRDSNRGVLKRLGTVVYLKVTAGEAVARIGDRRTRPLLAGPGGTLAATTLLAARETVYASVADVTVDTTGRSASEVAQLILDSITKDSE